MTCKDRLRLECIFCGKDITDLNIMLICQRCGATTSVIDNGKGEYLKKSDTHHGVIYESVICSCGCNKFDTVSDDVCTPCSVRFADLYARMAS